LSPEIIVTAKMNEFPKGSKVSINKQTKQHIFKTFIKIKDISHGDNGNVKCKTVETVADVFSVNPNLK
jgi:hypothetical protein